MARVLITGTSKGIGLATTEVLARAGHDVIATLRNPDAAPELGKLARDAGLPIAIEPLDVDDDAAVAESFARFAREHGPLDALVNNAGIFSINAIEDESLEKFQRVMNTNYFGTLRCIKAVLPGMRERGAGCIVNVTSIAGRIAFSPGAAYGASKFAAEVLSEILAQEVRSHGIRVAIVEPGIISTPMATTDLPQYAPETIYPQGRRNHAFFAHAEREPASPELVAQKIQEIIEGGGSGRLRHPVGPDALSFLGWRSTQSDESWIDLWGTPDDDDFYARVERETGSDVRAESD